MKKFLEYLFEQMSFSDAMKVFGIDAVPNKSDLDKLYKKLALKNHPDLGGSEEKMKEINQAKDVLDKRAGSSSSTNATYGGYSKEQRAEDDKQYEVFATAIAAEMKSFDLQTYESYLEKIFGVPFKSEFKINDRDRYRNGVNVGIEFSDAERNKVFYLFLMADAWSAFWEARRKGGLATADKTVYKITMRSDVMIDGKKQALTKSRYVNSNEAKMFRDPEVLLPSKRLQKFASGEARKNSKLSKRDFIGLFTMVFKCEHEKVGNADMFIFKTAQDFVVVIQRTTFGGSVDYRVYIHEKSSSPYYRWERKPKTPDLSFTHSIQENQKSYDFFKDFLKKLDGFKTKKAIYDYIDAVGEEICGYKYK